MNQQMQYTKLYLDDVRNPKSDGWVIVRTYDEFKNWISLNGVPDEISFDHDLSNEDETDENGFTLFAKTGYDAAKWLCNYCWTNGLPIPKWNVHSANPVGRMNISQLLSGYEKRLN